MHHWAVDGPAALHFISTWADIVRGITTDLLPIKPFFDRTLLRSRAPPSILFDPFEYKPNPNPNNNSSNSPSASSILKLSRSQVSLLKSAGKTKPLSTVRAVTAHMWRCLCIARGLDPHQNTRLFLTVDIRNRLKPQLPAGFFGNAIIIASAAATAAEITSNSIGSVAEKIREALERLDDEYVRSLIDYMGTDIDRPWKFLHESGDLHVISWLSSMPTYSADFGWGRPEFMGRASSLSGKFVYLMQSSWEEEGGICAPVTLEVDVIDRFKEVVYKELELLGNEVEDLN